MEVDLVDEVSPEWTAFLDAVRHDVYHLPSYGAMTAAHEGGVAGAIIAREGDSGILLPVIIRPIPGEAKARDAISAYGYPGPLFLGERDSAFVARAFNAMIGRLQTEGIISLFVRTHPLLNEDLAGMESVGTIVEHGQTVSVDLTTSAEEQWTGTRADHRYQINRAIRAGHRAYIDEDWVHEAAFVEIYTATMNRVGANAGYMFGVDYVRALRSALGSRVRLCVVDIGGAIAAAGLFTEEDGIVQYHLSGTDGAFIRDRPTKLMLHYVRGFMKERNNRVLHLGGGLGGAEDSLFEFKSGFSKSRHLFRTWRVVVDPGRYTSLARERDPSVDLGDATGFFPIYRRSPI